MALIQKGNDHGIGQKVRAVGQGIGMITAILTHQCRHWKADVNKRYTMTQVG